MHTIVRLALAACLTMLAGLAFAEMPASGAIYADPDPAAMVRAAAIPGQKIDYTPANAVSIASRAYMILRAGQTERARKEINLALKLAEDREDYRHVLWSAGWAFYDMGQVDDALMFWQASVRRHGGHPFWAAYTYALGYWTRGDKPTALAWYGVAVRSNPQWAERTGFETRTRAWRPQQRERMHALYRAWKRSESASRKAR